MMRYVFSLERWSDGLVLEFCRNGCFLRWLERLKEIDDSNEGAQSDPQERKQTDEVD